MQIRLRPSGGRGEYELAGSHGKVRGSDLYGLELWFQFGLDLCIPLYAIADVHDGKPRIRLNDQHVHKHAARVLAALLLIPEPIREIRKTEGSDELIDFHRCACSSILVDVVNKDASRVVLRPRAMILINKFGASKNIDVLNRFELISQMWMGAVHLPDELRHALTRHYAISNTFPLNHKSLIDAAKLILSIPNIDNYINPNIVSDSDLGMTPPILAEDDPSSPIDVNRELRKKLAWRVERGVDGRRFKQDVSNAYGYKCVFTGVRLPPLGKGYLPGVDAAHIYPWSRMGSNEVTNGLSLSKQMHWAFDEGILRLTFDQNANIYLIDIPNNIIDLARDVDFDIAYYQSICGPVPLSNLPEQRAMWPSKKSLELYNDLMFPKL